MVGKEETRSSLEAAFVKVVDGVSRRMAYVAATLVAFWPLLFVLYIILRESGWAYWDFVEEYTTYWLVMTVCLALGYTLRSEGHIRIEVVSQRLPKRVMKIGEILITLLALGVVGIFTGSAWDNFVFAFTHKVHYAYVASSGALLWPFYLWMPVGYGILGLSLLLHLYLSVMRARKDWQSRS